MKRYLLDTSLVAAFLHGRKRVIELIDPWVRKQEAATSILVYGEVIEYLKGLADYSRYQARLQRLFTLEQITPYLLTYPILERYADIRRTLRPLPVANVPVSQPHSQSSIPQQQPYIDTNPDPNSSPGSSHH